MTNGENNEGMDENEEIAEATEERMCNVWNMYKTDKSDATRKKGATEKTAEYEKEVKTMAAWKNEAAECGDEGDTGAEVEE